MKPIILFFLVILFCLPVQSQNVDRSKTLSHNHLIDLMNQHPNQLDEIIQWLIISQQDDKDSRNITTRTILGDGYLIERNVKQNWDGNEWINNIMYEYTYDENDNMTESLLQRWDDSNWIGFYIFIYEFDDNNNSIKWLVQNWDGEHWINNAMTENEYDLNNNLIYSENYLWFEDHWILSRNQTFVYDNENRLTEEKSQIWNGYWVDERRSEYSYTIFDTTYQVVSISQVWYSPSWANEDRSISTYDKNNNLIEIIRQEWGTSDWENKKRNVYQFDEKRMLEDLAQLWDGSDWMNDTWHIYTYEDKKKIEHIYKEWVSSDWLNINRNLYTYDFNDNQIQDLSQVWGGSSWEDDNRNICAFDLYGNKIEDTRQNWTGIDWINIDRDIYEYSSSPKFTYPKKGDVLISGQKNKIKWDGGIEGELVTIKYSQDGGESFRILDSNISITANKYEWEIPDDFYNTRSILMLVGELYNEILAETDTFSIKPLIITKLDDNGNHIPYNINIDRWGFGNDGEKVWPSWYYNRNDYRGIDPFTGNQYDQYVCAMAFFLADPADFPDWKSFVNAFTLEACYKSTTIPVAYSLTALERWKANKAIWDGSCFGIAAANALAFERKEDYIENFPGVSSFDYPINLTTPDTGDIAAISSLFVHQFGNPTVYNDNISYNIKTPTQTLFETIEMLNEDDVKLRPLSIYNNNGSGGHTILPYRVVYYEDVSPNLFFIMVYDNSYPDAVYGYIEIDTSANSGDGTWTVSYAWNDWGGTKNIYLEIPDSIYLKPAELNKRAYFQSPFILTQNEIEINTTTDAAILIEDNSNNVTGYQNNQVISDIPGSRPLMVKNGSEGPPYGYYLQKDNYEIEMNSFASNNYSLYLFTDNKSFSIKRDDATQNQTDKINYWQENKLEINNPDNESKSFQVTEILNESEMEKMYILRNVNMNQNDLFDIVNIDNDKLKITNNGSQKNYEIELESVNENGLQRFLNRSVTLPINSNHTLQPNWENVTSDQLEILVDIGNNGTIDDTLEIQNQVTGIREEQGLLIPTEYRLEQNYPNPFNNSTIIRYSIPKEGIVTLKIYNAIGEEVTTIVNEVKQPGNYEATFDTEDFTSGVYFYRIQAGSFVQTRKMVLIK